MIFFCEDCGGKNVTEPEQIKGGVVTYRCGACNYLNVCPVSRRQGAAAHVEVRRPNRRCGGTEGPPVSADRNCVGDVADMPLAPAGSASDRGRVAVAAARRALGEINAFPGIIGSFVFHQGNEILLSAIPKVPGEEELVAISKILTENFRLGRAEYADMDEMTLVLRKTAIVVRRAGAGFFIVVISESFPLPPALTTILDRASQCLTEIGGAP